MNINKKQKPPDTRFFLCPDFFNPALKGYSVSIFILGTNKNETRGGVNNTA